MEATDLADFLAKEGLVFRDAHRIVAKLVLYCEQQGCQLSDLIKEELASFHPSFDSDKNLALKAFDVLEARKSYGASGPQQCKLQLEEAAKSYKDLELILAKLN